MRCLRAAVAACSLLGSTEARAAMHMGRLSGLLHSLSTPLGTHDIPSWQPGSSSHWHVHAAAGAAASSTAGSGAPAAAAARGLHTARYSTDATGPGSAAASAAAALSAELQALQGAGLSRTTAAAVHKVMAPKHWQQASDARSQQQFSSVLSFRTQPVSECSCTSSTSCLHCHASKATQASAH